MDIAGQTASGPAEGRVERPEDVVEGIKGALAHDGPFLLDLVTDPNALSIPPHISAAQVKGFAFAAGRTVLEGGVGRMLDLARSNLRNNSAPLNGSPPSGVRPHDPGAAGTAVECADCRIRFRNWAGDEPTTRRKAVLNALSER